ncbi:MAG: hypothetical protein JRF35_08045 [Deltaproteobacteria bacterium]|nr:hypothetical protein [Deltaproteobacteria bacterium]
MKHITLITYQRDKYYCRLVRGVAKFLARSDVVTPSDVLIEMGNLSRKNYEAWCKGQVPYLERVFEGSLSKANRILRIIGFHVHDLNMVSRQAVYHQWGKGKNRILRFSKSDYPNIEKAYSRHYTWNRSAQEKQIAINNALPKQVDTVYQGHRGPIDNY